MGQGEEPAGPRPPQSLPRFTQLSAGPSQAPQSPKVFRQTWLALFQLTGHQPPSAGWGSSSPGVPGVEMRMEMKGLLS